MVRLPLPVFPPMPRLRRTGAKGGVYHELVEWTGRQDERPSIQFASQITQDERREKELLTMIKTKTKVFILPVRRSFSEDWKRESKDMSGNVSQ